MACCEETGLAASQTKYDYTFSNKIEWDWRLIVSQTVRVIRTALHFKYPSYREDQDGD